MDSRTTTSRGLIEGCELRFAAAGFRYSPRPKGRGRIAHDPIRYPHRPGVQLHGNKAGIESQDDGDDRITVLHSMMDVDAEGAVVAITPPHEGARRGPAGGDCQGVRMFGPSESQIARRVKVIARA